MNEPENVARLAADRDAWKEQAASYRQQRDNFQGVVDRVIEVRERLALLPNRQEPHVVDDIAEALDAALSPFRFYCSPSDDVLG